MKYKLTTEHSSPDRDSLALVEETIENIILKPDQESLNKWYTKFIRNNKKRLAYDIDYVTRHIAESSKIVEFGSIPPILTASLNKLKYDVYGIDIAPERFQNAISSLNLRIDKVDIETESLPFCDNKFDGAIFNEIFEHLRINPIRTLNEVYRVMKPGGILLLSTPNLTSLSGWINLVFKNKSPVDIYKQYIKLESLGHMGHVRMYTAIEVCDFLSNIGFKIIEVIYRGTFQLHEAWKQYIVKISLSVFPQFRPRFSILALKP